MNDAASTLAPAPAQTPTAAPAALTVNRAAWPADHPAVNSGKIGVLLLNLGTPDGTDYWSMRRYLKEFLSDRRIIEIPRLIWWPILNGIILTTRPGRKGRDYAAIWNNERNEGPLKTFTRAQAEKLARGADRPSSDHRRLGHALRQSLDGRAASRRCRQQGCERILLVPLYPQYAAATTATAADQAFRALMKLRWQPAVRVAPAWHDDPVYIQALAQSVRTHIAGLGYEPEILFATFHGMPRRCLDLGDPYHCQCMKTARLLREELAWPQDRYVVAFQSLFGKAEWLRPYTDQTVEALAKRGVKSAGHGRAGLHRRLPGDAGRTRRREPRDFREERRREVQLYSLFERQPGRDAGHRDVSCGAS